VNSQILIRPDYRKDEEKNEWVIYHRWELHYDRYEYTPENVEIVSHAIREKLTPKMLSTKYREENRTISKNEAFSKDGSLIQSDTYENGIVSKYEFIREDGTLKQIYTYENGIVSKLEFFREDGSLTQIDTYRNGVTSNLKSVREDGTIRQSETYENGVVSKNEFFREDVVIAISQSGKTQALLDSMNLVKKRGGTVIGIAPSSSPVAKKADVPLEIDAEEEFQIHTPLSSRIAQLTIIDTLTIGVAQKKGTDLQDHLKRLQTGLKSLRCDQ
jgi:antitoxin component YwqK of YwqJK toxin-antitoxin module